MTHRDTIDRYPGSLGELAEDIGNLRYDGLEMFLRALAAKLEADATRDEGRGRVRLAALLRGGAAHLAASAAEIQKAWHLCEPYMRPASDDSLLRRPP